MPNALERLSMTTVRRTFLLALLGCATLGCSRPATDAPAAREAPKPQVHALSVSHDPLPLTFSPDGKTFPSPVARVAINGRPTWLVVDTGASFHALASWFAQEIQAPVEHPAGAQPIARDITIASGTSVVTLRATLPVVETPAALRALGIGGFLSPSSLFPPGGAVVLDMPKGELRAFTREQDADPLFDKAASLPLEVCGARDSGHSKIFCAHLSVNASPVLVEIDTGAQASYFYSSSALAPPSQVTDRASIVGVDGRALNAVRVPDVNLSIGDLRKKTSVILVVSARPQLHTEAHLDGVLGADVLRDCVLRLGTTTGNLKCVR